MIMGKSCGRQQLSATVHRREAAFGNELKELAKILGNLALKQDSEVQYSFDTK
jgi:hypothetical protein